MKFVSQTKEERTLTGLALSVHLVEVWLRGVDLNHRPLGYEDNNQLARLCLFNHLAAGVSCCFSLVFGVLFAECSYICSFFRLRP